MKYIYLLFLCLTTSFALQASDIATISKVVSESSEKETMISVKFQSELKDLSKVEVQEHGSFIQVVIPGAIMSEPGKFFDGNSKLVRKIAGFQISETTVGIRLFVAEEAAKVKPALSTDFLGDRLSILIEHDKLATAADKSPFAGVPPVNKVIKETEVREDTKDPAKEVMAATGAAPAETDSEPFLDIDNNMIVAAAFSLVMFVGLIIFSTMRRLKLNTSLAQGDTIVMKTLASFNLAPKQRLTLVEVGGEKILLGLTPDNINFLTNIKTEQESNYDIRSQKILSQVAAKSIQDRKNASQTLIPNHKKQKQALAASEAKPSSETLTSQPKPAAPKTSTPQTAKAPAKRVSYAVGDNGIKDLAAKSETKVAAKKKPSAEAGKEEPQSIEDVTNLIRRKLRNLPNIDS